MIFLMAWRNVFRQKKRTMLTLITIVFGIFLGIMGDGLNGGMRWQVADAYINNMTSTFKIYKKGYFNPDEIQNQIEYGFSDSLVADEVLTKFSFVKAMSKRLNFDGHVTNGSDDFKIKMTGILVSAEEQVFHRQSTLVAGQFFSENGKAVVLGMELAKLLKANIGDIITISARSKLRTLNAFDVKVQGIIRTGNPLVDANFIFMPLSVAQELTDTKDINEIAILGKDKAIDKITEQNMEITKRVSPLQLESIPWSEETKDLLTLIGMREKVFNVITMVVLLMAAAGITNTMLMSMLERKKEIGIMTANGMFKQEVLFLFLAEGAILGVIGSTLGLLFGAILVNYFQKYGISIPVSKENLGTDFPIQDKIYFYFDIYKATFMYVLGIIIATIASAYPAIKALKLNPVEALRG